LLQFINIVRLQAWRSEIASKGNVNFKFNHEVRRIISRTSKDPKGPIQIEYITVAESMETAPQIAHFDQLILAIDADSSLKLLHNEATFMEKRVLGNVKYLYDVTITHNDLQYMKKVVFVSIVCRKV
jgi:hypothetical protein